MEKNKKRLTLWVLGTLAMITLSAGITWAFFSYIRTGDPNVFRTGNIYFNSEYTGAELTNVFPINKNKVDTDTENVMEVNVNIEGYTSYEQGVDYTIKATDVSLTAGGKNVPINAKVSSENVPNIQTYSFEEEMVVVDNAVFAQGNIIPEDGNVDGTVTIKAYIDKNNVVISDTYDGTESSEMGTTNDFVNGRQVFTTSEWNALESGDGVSFRVKVEAWEHEETLYDVMQANAVMDNIASEFVTSATGINFALGSSDENGKGLYKLSSTAEDKYPVVYYRGDVQDNNVLFGNFCWKAVRTTETGGVKLIYNGVPKTENGTLNCNNTSGMETQLENKSKFNDVLITLAGVGYMYNNIYSSKSEPLNENVYFGNSFIYNNGVYMLKDVSSTMDANHHYTCNSTSSTGTCASIRYYYRSSIYIQLTDGKSVEDAMNEMLYADDVNKVDSIIKNEIDVWYKNNMLKYTNQLEDTIWCNNRSLNEYAGWNPNGGDLEKNLIFEPFNRTEIDNNKLLKCENVTDKFSLSNKLANLSYPVALINIDEVRIAGGGGYTNNYYLKNNDLYFTMTPAEYSSSFGIGMNIIVPPGYLQPSSYANVNAIRPMISLAFGATIDDGDGTAANPYIISGK